ncbi:MAG: hypothetical protein JWL99_1525 [Streptomyces oryziradicis]|nr:hypothetical protein [Actinacidiphila oryziradicis]
MDRRLGGEYGFMTVRMIHGECRVYVRDRPYEATASGAKPDGPGRPGPPGER